METIEKLPNGNLMVRVDYVFSRHGGRKKIIKKDESKEISEKTHDMSVEPTCGIPLNKWLIGRPKVPVINRCGVN